MSLRAMGSRSPSIPCVEITSATVGASYARRSRVTCLLGLLMCIVPAPAVWCPPAFADDQPRDIGLDRVLKDQSERVAMIARVSPSVVCIYNELRSGGGSGVLIDADGYGLTNFHVVAKMLETRAGTGALSDGQFYELEVLGIDPTGDVAMFRLHGLENFPFAPLGDSDAVRLGDTAIAIGNPFVLSEDQTPSVSMGLVTGMHRYQKGTKGNLIYSDCIQVDAAINPGNSGGPLFNSAGEIIGINGRISINARGRYNVGFGYAITINQIKRFIPSLRAGLLAKHGTLDAKAVDVEGEGAVFTELLSGGAGYIAGVRLGDVLSSFDGISISSANHFASILGTYPDRWVVPLRVRRAGQVVKFHAQLGSMKPKIAIFKTDREVNLRQVQKVLDGYRGFVLGDTQRHLPRNWKWRATRRFLGGGGTERKTQTFEAVKKGEGPIRMRELYEDGAKGRTTVFDGASAHTHGLDESDRFDLPGIEGLVLRAFYLAHHHLLIGLDALDSDLVKHVGTDTVPLSLAAQRASHDGGATPPAMIPRSVMPGALDLRRQPPAASKPAAQRRSPMSTMGVVSKRMVECLVYRLDKHSRLKFAFDVETHALRWIEARDTTTNSVAVVEIHAYQTTDGAMLPADVEVHGGGLDYRDTLTDWEIQ